MPRYAPKMTNQDLRQKLIELALTNDYVEDYDEDFDPANPDMTSVVHMLLEENLPTVVKDWSKIDFSTENMDVIGEKMTAGGIPYLEIRAGGDWESALICILYFDGKTFRGYVPRAGNTYNHKTKSAFGNHESDEEACAKQFSSVTSIEECYRDVEPDMDLIAQDINGRIEAKGSMTHTPTGVVSNAKKKAARQAELEKSVDLSGPITPDMVRAVVEPAAGGAYFRLNLKVSGRELTSDEVQRVIGIPKLFTDTGYRKKNENLWYSPQGCYPAQAAAVLTEAGFEIDEDSHIPQGSGTRIIFMR